MNIILLSGGSGKRLWPLSNDIRSKQFIKIFKNKNGTYESMLQRIYNQIRKIDNNATITIATSNMQVNQIRNQLNNSVGISIEPERRDTFPAIVLATVYLNEIMKVDKNETVVVCPVDPYVDDDYFIALKELNNLASVSDSNLVLMGIKPTYPSEKFGYIIPSTNSTVSKVKEFKEKPNKEVAEEYIKNNALWNGGVFAYKIDYLLKKAHELIEFNSYQDLYEKYHTIGKISFDYAVVEKEPKIDVMRFNGSWEDLGTWKALTEKLEDNIIGNARLSETCQNVNVINELDIPVVCVGLKNSIVSLSLDGLLISNKEETDSIKKYLEDIGNEPRYIEYEWGNEKTISNNKNSRIVKLSINKGKEMVYYRQNEFNDSLIVLSGIGQVLNDVDQEIHPSDIIKINVDNVKIKAIDNLELLLVRTKKKE